MATGRDLPAAIDRALSYLAGWDQHEECLQAVEQALSAWQDPAHKPTAQELFALPGR